MFIFGYAGAFLLQVASGLVDLSQLSLANYCNYSGKYVPYPLVALTDCVEVRGRSCSRGDHPFHTSDYLSRPAQKKLTSNLIRLTINLLTYLIFRV
jgi:hypothetical protein